MPEKTWIMIRNWCEKEVPWKVKENFASYLLQFNGFERSRFFIEIKLPNASQIYPKWITWAPCSRYFKIWRCFRKLWILDEFWSRQRFIKVDHKSENLGQGLPKGKVFSDPAECAGPVGDYRGFKNLNSWKEFGMRLGLEFVLQQAVFPHEWGGGFKALARIPPGLRKVSLKGGVVLTFPPSSFDNLCPDPVARASTNRTTLKTKSPQYWKYMQHRHWMTIMPVRLSETMWEISPGRGAEKNMNGKRTGFWWCVLWVVGCVFGLWVWGLQRIVGLWLVCVCVCFWPRGYKGVSKIMPKGTFVGAI